MPQPPRRRIAIAVLALGGQGGGVLTRWIGDLGASGGYRTQATSVPGVAQRTGATTYYVEMTPWEPGSDEPILSLTPTPGDVDIVLASELMEAGRAVLRGFVSGDLTTLITSTHRVYAISEKSAKGNGIRRAGPILEAAARRSKRLIQFDMAAAAETAGCGLSAVMLGALAGSKALPFRKEAFIEAIHRSGMAIGQNVKGFEAGFQAAQQGAALEPAQSPVALEPTTQHGRRLFERILRELPVPAHYFAVEGVRRLLDYQDAPYANLYLDRLAAIHALDKGRGDWHLTRETARYLALWMSYEDTIRVAGLKVRGTRVARVHRDARASANEIVAITEFMHPRVREFCETLPRVIGRPLLNSQVAQRALAPLFRKGRFIETTNVSGFLMLSFIASLRRWRRLTVRFAEEDARISTWLETVRSTAGTDPATALEIVRCQRLIKGYGDTFDRGLATFNAIMAKYREIAGSPGASAQVRVMREAALGSAMDAPGPLPARAHPHGQRK